MSVSAAVRRSKRIAAQEDDPRLDPVFGRRGQASQFQHLADAERAQRRLEAEQEAWKEKH